jgi:hypothetical protein
MNIRYHDRGKLSSDARRALESRVHAWNSRLSNGVEHLTFLDVAIVHHPQEQTYTVILVLRSPDHELAVSGKGLTQSMALQDALDDLLDKTEYYRATVTNLPAIRRGESFQVTKAAMARAALEASQMWESEPSDLNEE